MLTIRLDYETRSRADISLGAYEYALDPTTRVLCLAAKVGDGGERVVVRFDPNGPREQPMPGILSEAVAKGAIVKAFNAGFEQVIWRHVLGWPEPSGWECTMAKCAVNGLPQSLQGAAEYLGLAGKHDAGAKVMKKACQPNKKTGEFPDLTEAEWADLLAYCAQDVETEEAIDAACGPFPVIEMPVWQACNRINMRGLAIDRALCEAAVAVSARLGEACDADVRKATADAVTGADLTRVEWLLEWVNAQGVELEALDATALAGALRRKALPDAVRVVLESRRKIARASVKKHQAMLEGTAIDGRLRGQLRYCAAGPGRWKSRGEPTFHGRDGNGVQIQNLIKPPRFMTSQHIREAIAATLSHDLPQLVTLGQGDVAAALTATVRPAIVPGPGKLLAVVDYAAVEARGSLWLAGDVAHLKWFSDADAKRGPPPYCKMASKTFGREIKAKKDDPVAYDAGKVQMLMFQYGAGGQKAEDTCALMGIDVAALGFTGQRLVDEYRAEFKSLAGGWVYDPALGRKAPTGLWGRLDQAAKHAIQWGERVDVGAITFGPGKFGDLAMRLPSGRVVRYHKACIVKGEKFGNDQVQYTDLRVKHPVDMYGGKWLENATQATCRDLLADALVRLEAAGLPVVMHVHDEAVCEVDQSTAQHDLARMEAIMREGPAWAKGFPIATEGFITTRYGKGAF